MLKSKVIYSMLLMAATTMFSVSCENDNINPYDYVDNGNDNNQNQGSAEVLKTTVAEYPVGSLVWTKDTTLTRAWRYPSAARSI